MEKVLDELIIEDHQELRFLLTSYNKTISNEENYEIICKFLLALARHSIAKELIFYPLLKTYVPNGDFIVTESLNEHNLVKEKINEIKKLNFSSVEFDVKLEFIGNNLIEHLYKEEKRITLLKIYVPIDLRIQAANNFENRKNIMPKKPLTNVVDNNPNIESLVNFVLTSAESFADYFTDLKIKKHEKYFNVVKDEYHHDHYNS